jgi:hypothetical protein
MRRIFQDKKIDAKYAAALKIADKVYEATVFEAGEVFRKADWLAYNVACLESRSGPVVISHEDAASAVKAKGV